MIVAGILQGVVKAIIDVADEAAYAVFAPHFDNLIDTSAYPTAPTIGWTFDGQTFHGFGADTMPPSIRITRLAFRNRFTPTEKASIVAFAAQANAYGYALTAALQDQLNATYIDLARADTIASVNNLANPPFSLITPTRATEILTTPPTLEELYKG